ESIRLRGRAPHHHARRRGRRPNDERYSSAIVRDRGITRAACQPLYDFAGVARRRPREACNLDRPADDLGGKAAIQHRGSFTIHTGERRVKTAILSCTQATPHLHETRIPLLLGEPLEKRRAGEICKRAAFVAGAGVELLVSRQLSLERPLSEKRGAPRGVR